MTVSVNNLGGALASGDYMEAEFREGEWWVTYDRNLIWHVTAPTVAAGALTSVTLPEGQ
jgi:hypothetical protein